MEYEVERELFGWKFALFQEFDGNTLLRSIKERFNLLEQARDLTRILTKAMKSDTTSAEDKVLLRNFIENTSNEAARGCNTSDWFQDATTLASKISIQLEREDVRGLFRVDNTVEVGKQIVCKVIKPQVLYKEKEIQKAKVDVKFNPET